MLSPDGLARTAARIPPTISVAVCHLPRLVYSLLIAMVQVFGRVPSDQCVC